MNRIICVEDDESIRELVLYALRGSGYEAEGYESAEGLLPRLEQDPPDLVLLDIMLPGQDGISVLCAMKETPALSSVPVIMLTAKTAEYDRVRGLDAGADDYVVKPFGVMELLSRIRAVLRRARPAPAQDTALCVCGRITLDPARRAVTVDEGEVRLTYKEFELLYYLMQNQGLVMSRDKLMEAVWGFDFEGESRTVDMHIKSLRRKLADCGSYVQTIRGVGYKIDDAVGG